MPQYKQRPITEYFGIKRNGVKRLKNPETCAIKRKKTKLSKPDCPKNYIDDNNVIVLSDDDEERKVFKQNKTTLPAPNAHNEIDLTESIDALNLVKVEYNNSPESPLETVVNENRSMIIDRDIKNEEDTSESTNSELTILVKDENREVFSENKTRLPAIDPIYELTVSENRSTIMDQKNEEDTVSSNDTDELIEELEPLGTLNGISRSPSLEVLIEDNNDNSFRMPNKKAGPSNCTPKKHINNGNNNLIEGSSPKYSPKTPSGKSPTQYKNTELNRLIHRVIENLNSAKQGVIPPNNFDLNEIYSRNKFEYAYSNNINASTSTKYEVNGIQSYEFHSYVFLSAICTVLANPINCGYFDEDELDLIYQILTLPEDALILLARIIKRQKKWFMEKDINYPMITNTELAMKILVSKNICVQFTEDLPEALELLDAKTINRLCKKFKIKLEANKRENIIQLMKLSEKKPLFIDSFSPGMCLLNEAYEKLGYCIKISANARDVINRIIILLIPIYDPKLNIKDVINHLCDVYSKKIKYPKNPGDYFPVFSNKSHLVKYIEATSKLFDVIKCIEKKNWEEVERCVTSTLDNLPVILIDESERLKVSKLPTHVKRYMPGYKWLKILDKCIQGFKKNKELAVQALNFLLEQQFYMHECKGKWSNDLCLIQMNYFKENIEDTASFIMQALAQKDLTVIDKVDLWERANMIYDRKTGGIKICTKADLMKVIAEHAPCIPQHKPSSNDITATLMSGYGKGKSTWRLERNSASDTYGSVESVALQHYADNGFPKGWHCEGALPITLFFTLFWEELYDMHIPGAFVTSYQEAPSDLFTTQFYENRRRKIDTKINEMNKKFDNESFSIEMEKRYHAYKEYVCPITKNCNITEIVRCLGIKGVLGICKRLCENYKVWKAGFPDLFVWNINTKECKIVEVKGPKDKLSTKQRLWLDYLHGLGLNTELCLVKSIHS